MINDPAQIIAFIRSEQADAQKMADTFKADSEQKMHYGWLARARALQDILEEIPGTPENEAMNARARDLGIEV